MSDRRILDDRGIGQTKTRFDWVILHGNRVTQLIDFRVVSRVKRLCGMEAAGSRTTDHRDDDDEAVLPSWRSGR